MIRQINSISETLSVKKAVLIILMIIVGAGMGNLEKMGYTEKNIFLA